MDMKYMRHDPSELISIMRARIAEQPDMFITTLENYESLKSSQLNYTPNNTHNSRNNVKESVTCIQKSQREIVCPKCRDSFSIGQHYESHKQTCQLQCKLCFKTFINLYTLKRHIYNMHKLNQFQCNLCSHETFSTTHGLKKHFKEAHNEDLVYKCPSCAKLIGTLFFFTKHIQNHINTKKCGICDAKYVCGKALKNHIQKHKLKNPNICITSEIIKTNEPVIKDYSQCIVDLKRESDSDTEENTEDGNEVNSLTLFLDSQNSTDCDEQILKNEEDTNNKDSVNCVKGLLGNADVSDQKTDDLSETMVNRLSNDINKQNTSTNCLEFLKTGEDKTVADSPKILKQLKNDSVYEVLQKE